MYLVQINIGKNRHRNTLIYQTASSDASSTVLNKEPSWNLILPGIVASAASRREMLSPGLPDG